MIKGDFKVSGTGWLCRWDHDHNRWHPIMKLDDVQIAYWNSMEQQVSDNEILDLG